MPENQYDLVIIGAGVASASALIRLQGQGLKIAVVAPKSRPDFRIGETLGPAGTEELRRLRLLTPYQQEGHWLSTQKFSCWGTDQLIRVPYTGGPNPSWYLDRVAFETFLWQEAQKTDFEHVAEKALKAQREDDAWHVSTDEDTLSGNMLLDASGRSAVITRNLINRMRHDKLVAAYVCLQQQEDDVEATQATMIEALPGGWFYSVLVPGNRLVVSWFTDSDMLPEGISQKEAVWQSLIEQSNYTYQRIESAGFMQSATARVVDASTITTDAIAGDKFFMAGDTAACFDPLSSHGMTTALWSGRRVAESILALKAGDSSELDRYTDSYLQGIEKYLLERQQTYAQEQRFSEEEFWKRRAQPQIKSTTE